MNALKRDRHNRGSNVVDETVLPERKAVASATAPRGMAGVLTGTIRLPANVKSLSFDYRSATPFPYLILDNLFSEDLLDRVTQELPPLGDAHWVRHDDDHLRQFNLRSAADLGEAGSQVVAFLHSARFLYFISEVTGIRDLLPDPYLQGAGYHMIPRGGKFDVHLDRNIAYSTGLIRRLSLLIYLNRDWKHEYGGQLELWSKDGKRPEVVRGRRCSWCPTSPSCASMSTFPRTTCRRSRSAPRHDGDAGIPEPDIPGDGGGLLAGRRRRLGNHPHAASLDNSSGELMPGGYASVKLNFQRDTAPLSIPASALIFNGSGLRVATVGPDDKVQFKTVTIARDLGKEIELASGIAPDDRVITAPPDGLSDGDQVRVVGAGR